MRVDLVGKACGPRDLVRRKGEAGPMGMAPRASGDAPSAQRLVEGPAHQRKISTVECAVDSYLGLRCQ
jgi:hypothetical protein